MANVHDHGGFLVILTGLQNELSADSPNLVKPVERFLIASRKPNSTVS